MPRGVSKNKQVDDLIGVRLPPGMTADQAEVILGRVAERRLKGVNRRKAIKVAVKGLIAAHTSEYNVLLSEAYRSLE